MVVALGPGKFYGSSLPRPRIYDNNNSDLKLNEERIDPPVPVTDPLISWANEAHWSMGGLSFKRQRLQGRIEGSIKKLRAAEEKETRKASGQNNKDAPMLVPSLRGLCDSDTDTDEPIGDASPDINVNRSPRTLKKKEKKKRGNVEKNSIDIKSSPAGFGMSTRARCKRDGDDLISISGKSVSVSPKLRTSPRVAKEKRNKG